MKLLNVESAVSSILAACHWTSLWTGPAGFNFYVHNKYVRNLQAFFFFFAFVFLRQPRREVVGKQKLVVPKVHRGFNTPEWNSYHAVSLKSCSGFLLEHKWMKTGLLWTAPTCNQSPASMGPSSPYIYPYITLWNAQSSQICRHSEQDPGLWSSLSLARLTCHLTPWRSRPSISIATRAQKPVCNQFRQVGDCISSPTPPPPL